MWLFFWSTAQAFDESPRGLMRDTPDTGENLLWAMLILILFGAVTSAIVWLLTRGKS